MSMLIGGKQLPVRRLAQLIRALGIPVQKVTVSPDPQVEDDEIIITDAVHVQVPSLNAGPAAVGVMFEDSLYPWPERNEVGLLVADIQAACSPDWMDKRLQSFKE